MRTSAPTDSPGESDRGRASAGELDSLAVAGRQVRPERDGPGRERRADARRPEAAAGVRDRDRQRELVAVRRRCHEPAASSRATKPGASPAIAAGTGFTAMTVFIGGFSSRSSMRCSSRVRSETSSSSSTAAKRVTCVKPASPRTATRYSGSNGDSSVPYCSISAISSRSPSDPGAGGRPRG